MNSAACCTAYPLCEFFSRISGSFGAPAPRGQRHPARDDERQRAWLRCDGHGGKGDVVEDRGWEMLIEVFCKFQLAGLASIGRDIGTINTDNGSLTTWGQDCRKDDWLQAVSSE